MPKNRAKWVQNREIFSLCTQPDNDAWLEVKCCQIYSKIGTQLTKTVCQGSATNNVN